MEFTHFIDTVGRVGHLLCMAYGQFVPALRETTDDAVVDELRKDVGD